MFKSFFGGDAEKLLKRSKLPFSFFTAYSGYFEGVKPKKSSNKLSEGF